MNVLQTLHAAGLTVRADGDRLIVTPSSLLTDDLRTLIRANKDALLVDARLTAALVAAIHRACDLRGDGDSAGLIAECRALTPEQQADMLAHFTIEAARWAKATGKAFAPTTGSPDEPPASAK